jgi:aryl-alcohol dehydrogenase-like predicted oxidoreductase
MNGIRYHTRRELLALGASLVATTVIHPARAQSATAPVRTRAIPRSGEKLSVIGLGTAIIFDIGGDTEKRAERTKVIHTLLDGGARMIDMLKTEKLDFIQVNYSMAERSVEDKLLAVAAETGTAVLCNLPFARAALFRVVQGKTVPDWATAEFDALTWGQFFLKYLLANEAINAVLPGTDKPEYMIDNLAAARTRLPNAAQRKRMVEFMGTV